jgi:hypothetical protein
MKKYILLTYTLLCFFIAPVFAQDDDERNDKVEALRIAFITEKLNLSSEEAKVFWPVFNGFTTELKKLRSKLKESSLTYSVKQSPSDQDANKFINDYVSLKQQELDLTKRYLNEFKKVLPEQKVAQLLTLEQEFKKQLLQRLKNKQGKLNR